jgi:hypothetical protein
MTDPLRITMTDIIDAGHCPSGTRRWFEGYGLDFRAFLRGGIAADELLATGDALAVQVVNRTRAKRERGNG